MVVSLGIEPVEGQEGREHTVEECFRGPSSSTLPFWLRVAVLDLGDFGPRNPKKLEINKLLIIQVQNSPTMGAPRICQRLVQVRLSTDTYVCV